MPTDATAKNMRGRPEAQFTTAHQNMAYGLVLQGVPYDKIARAIGISVPTLKKHLGDTLDEAKRQCIARVAGNLLDIATRPSGGAETVSAAKFFLGSQAGWLEKQQMQLTGAGGETLKVNVNFHDADGGGEC